LIVVKELSVPAKNVADSFRFKNAYNMPSYSSKENVLNSVDGHIAYHDLYTVVHEAVAGFAHLYSYGVTNAVFSPNSSVARFLTCRFQMSSIHIS